MEGSARRGREGNVKPRGCIGQGSTVYRVPGCVCLLVLDCIVVCSHLTSFSRRGAHVLQPNTCHGLLVTC